MTPGQDLSTAVYAWNWFALHSAQRMQLVNFWLVAVSFLAAAFVQARTAHMLAVSVGVCVAGALASVSFFLLDVRTRQLVGVAEAALQRLEADRLAAGEDASAALVGQAAAVRRSRVQSYLHSYRMVIGGLQLSVGLLFLAALGYSIAYP